MCYHGRMQQTMYAISKSILAPAALAAQITANYDLGGVRCQLLATSMRDVYVVSTTKQRFALIVYPTGHRPYAQVQAEWDFVAFLAQNGVPVAPAMRTRSSDHVISFDAPEGVRYGVLTPWLPGDNLRRRASPASITRYGTLIATIHMLADTLPMPLDRPDNDPVRIINDAVVAAEAALPDRPDILDALQQAREEILPIARTLVSSTPAFGLIHGDVIRANALATPDERVSILDFDLCGLGWRAYDVASYLFAIRGTVEEPVYRQAFLAGYTQQRPLSRIERETLPMFEAIRALFDIGIPAQYVDTWGRAALDGFLDHSIAQISRCVAQMRSA
jgi:Ser/Thr protein kinase RdoA (MazF antagonist)